MAILETNASDWILEGEPPAETIHGQGLPHMPFYEQLITGVAAPLERNLRRSDSAICLAGRATGESAARAVNSAVRLACGETETDLSELLTVHHWSPGTVSRVSFFNSRTQHLDRNIGFTTLVVADGDTAFLRTLEAPEFERSDIIGVIPRTIDRDRLESIGTKLADLAQWYVTDNEALGGNSTPPTGITISVLQRRQA